MAQTKQTNYTFILLLLFVCSVLYWIVGNSIDVYRFAIVGTVFEILWLPMLLLLFGTPVLAIVLWFRGRKKHTA